MHKWSSAVRVLRLFLSLALAVYGAESERNARGPPNNIKPRRVQFVSPTYLRRPSETSEMFHFLSIPPAEEGICSPVEEPNLQHGSLIFNDVCSSRLTV